jgi:lipid II:glycine glycyltransferase (peptidoglycan interpeptide bridge formation enzyme)
MDINSVITGRRGVALPFSDYCDPIVEDEEDLESGLKTLMDHGRKEGWRYIELRGGELKSSFPCFNLYYVHSLDLAPGADAIFRNLRKGTKSAITKAKRDGVEVEIGDSMELINDFYYLNCITRKRHGIPPQPYRFFKNVHEYVISRGHGKVVIAKYGNQIISGGIFFCWANKVIYKYGASNESFNNLRATNLVIWEAIDWFAKNGFRKFCFGRTEPENSGLRLFKNGWGTEETVLKYYRYDVARSAFIPGKNDIHSSLKHIFNMTPIPLLKMIGSLTYKHIG